TSRGRSNGTWRPRSGSARWGSSDHSLSARARARSSTAGMRERRGGEGGGRDETWRAPWLRTRATYASRIAAVYAPHAAAVREELRRGKKEESHRDAEWRSGEGCFGAAQRCIVYLTVRPSTADRPMNTRRRRSRPGELRVRRERTTS